MTFRVTKVTSEVIEAVDDRSQHIAILPASSFRSQDVFVDNRIEVLLLQKADSRITTLLVLWSDLLRSLNESAQLLGESYKITCNSISLLHALPSLDFLGYQLSNLFRDCLDIIKKFGFPDAAAYVRSKRFGMHADDAKAVIAFYRQPLKHWSLRDHENCLKVSESFFKQFESVCVEQSLSKQTESLSLSVATTSLSVPTDAKDSLSPRSSSTSDPHTSTTTTATTSDVSISSCTEWLRATVSAAKDGIPLTQIGALFMKKFGRKIREVTHVALESYLQTSGFEVDRVTRVVFYRSATKKKQQQETDTVVVENHQEKKPVVKMKKETPEKAPVKILKAPPGLPKPTPTPTPTLMPVSVSAPLPLPVATEAPMNLQALVEKALLEKQQQLPSTSTEPSSLSDIVMVPPTTSSQQQEADAVQFDISLETVEKLNGDIAECVAKLTPIEDELVMQSSALTLLRAVIEPVFAGGKLMPFGSSVNGFSLRGRADLDLCLVLEPLPMEKKKIILKLGDTLRAEVYANDIARMHNVKVIPNARVPVVKFTEPKYGFQCDISISNYLALENTQLLRDYTTIDPRLRELGLAVKHWAKCRSLNSSYEGTLSSYAYILIVIHFLQTREPPILPCLQNVGVDVERIMRFDHDITYDKDAAKFAGFGDGNKATVGELFFGLMRHYAYFFNYRQDVISVRTGSTLSTKDKKSVWKEAKGRSGHLFCIEDPFDIADDLGKNTDKNTIQAMKEEFQRAVSILSKGGSWDEVCELYKGN